MAKLTKRADGRYQMNVFIGKVDGKARYKTVYGATQREVQRKAEEVKAAIGKGLDITAQRDTFSAWRERWLKSKTCGAGQLASYKSCSAHLLGALGECELCKIRTSDIQTLVNDLAEKGLSKKTLGQVRMAAKQIFELAIVNRVLDYNPATAVTIPKTAKPPKQREALTDEQIRWVQETTDSKAYIPAMIMLYCGLRRGEVMALRWSDIDFTSRVIKVRRTVEMVNGQPVEKDGGKSDAAVRDVPIPDILMDCLRRVEPAPSKRGTILYPRITARTTGELHTDKSWSRMWKSFMEDINILHGDFSFYRYKPKSKLDSRGVPCVIETFTPHQLRHTYATLLYEAGVDVLMAQKLLGHSKPETTLNIYTHLREMHREIEVTKLNAYLNSDISQIIVKKAN